ncbi:hypothetical protein [Actinoplanes regularis]|uniref:hypothetical protein n=1 Tax=Actinoplanes regularis TaxID=52697 RepID=UPI0024A01135|nr:hypothetical protein [Actinoplanes regularis]GLW31206.1 hypothetical protein Areg01_41460 [Actinoplanes regularis]
MTDTDPCTAVTVLAEALDKLGARIHLDTAYNVAEDNPLYGLLEQFSGYTDECLTALDHPAVKATLADKEASQ